MGKVILDNLEKVGWIVLKCDYAITANSREQNHFYHLNNKSFKKSEYRWNPIHKTNRHVFYNINEPKHEQRFIEEDDILNKMSIIFQSDCDVINHHLNEEYQFDIINNKYKYYLPNLMTHYGKVDKD